MTEVVYVVDQYGWALHAIGEWLRDALAPHGVVLEITTPREWQRHPRPVETIYLAYSGLLRNRGLYRPHAKRLVTTVHDPCELSRFDDRDDWHRLPLRRLDFGGVDAISAISPQLTHLLGTRYRAPVHHTPTWSPRADRIRAAASSGAQALEAPLVAVSSTNFHARLPWHMTVRRFLAAPTYLLDERGRFTLAQLPATLVRRTRKRIDRLDRIVAAFARDPRVSCRFTTGSDARRSMAAYEDALLRADVYVCTSAMEGGPLPVLEAVMAGLAVLSTPVGQVAEWIEDGGSGFLCRSTDEFIARLQAYADDPALLHRHQARARLLAQQLAPDLTPWLRFLAPSAPPPTTSSPS